MFEIINEVDGHNIPQLVIVDESVEKGIARKMRENNIYAAYIENACGCEKEMPDEDILEMGRILEMCRYLHATQVFENINFV